MTVQELFEKALHDPAFWSELQKDPAKAFKEVHQELTPEQLKSLEPLNYHALEEVATAFGAGATVGIT